VNDKHLNDFAFRLSVRLSDWRPDPARCLPRKEEAKELPVAMKVALWDQACRILLQNASDASEGNAIPVESESLFAPNLTPLTNDTADSDKGALCRIMAR
jgi:hypothetical protein